MTRNMALGMVRAALVLDTLAGALFAFGLFALLSATWSTGSAALNAFAILFGGALIFVCWRALSGVRLLWRGESGDGARRALFAACLLAAWGISYPVLNGAETVLLHLGVDMSPGNFAESQIAPFARIALRISYWVGAHRLYGLLTKSVTDALFPDVVARLCGENRPD